MSDSVMTPASILPAPTLELSKPPDKWHRERQAFLQMRPHLLKTYADQYVAIHEGNVVGAGPDLVEVAMKAYARYGYVPIYVDVVSDRQPVPARISSPRLSEQK